MKTDEFAFVNLQLAGMLRSGIPLEGALHQLCATMQRGKLRSELKSLEADLARGTPLASALAARQLPELYRQMIRVGVQSNDLPGVLTMLADYYQKVSFIGTRLKGLMIYPAIVLFASLGLSLFLASFFRAFTRDVPEILREVLNDAVIGTVLSDGVPVMVWMPVIFLSAVTGFVLVTMALPALRRWLRYKLPGFKEASLSQLAWAMDLLLRGGSTLNDALGLLRCLEARTPLGQDIARWQGQLSAGEAGFPAIAAGSRIVPPLFSWLVSSGGENLAEGFRRTAEIYQARALHRIEMLLYAVLPVSILFLGVMLISQALPLVQLFFRFATVLDQLGVQ